jgi:hypothetical protein
MDEKQMDIWLGKTALTKLSFKNKTTLKTYSFDEALINVSRQKNIVETVVVGRDGTVKEFISNGDFSLDIQIGIESEDNFSYPEAELKSFEKLMSEKREIEVGSDFLFIFGITEIVVKSYSVPQQTHSNRQVVSIQAVSDKPYLMRIKEKE